jgi:molybdopterin/thiamine biosynthesis adenylyltransferase/rhodanese-related sulfurtransferase/molybdopterin converting factor small subunit
MSKVTVRIPAALRQYAKGDKVVDLEGTTVGEILETFSDRYPDIKKHLFDDSGKLRNFVNIYVNDDDVRYLQKNDTMVNESDTLSIIPSIAGGNFSGSNGDLSLDEIKRYSRHLIMPEVAMVGQKKIKHAKVLIIGAGGLGSPLALYLSAAGVGTIGIVDFDIVDETNLQRQVLYSTENIGSSKLDAAEQRIKSLNPEVQVVKYNDRLTSENALDIIKDYDIVVDGTDNYPTRYLVNDACVLLKKPNVYGSIFRFEGQATVFAHAEGPCYRCIYPEPPPPGLVPSCAEGGVLGVLPGIIGTIQATEVIKLIIGNGEPLNGRLLLFDALEMRFREVKLHKNKECPICGENPSITELIDYEQFCGIRGEEIEARKLDDQWEITPNELKQQLENGEDLFLLDVRNPEETDISRIEGSKLIPLHELAERLAELSTADNIVVHCHMGIRSVSALELMRQAGFRKIKHLVGGINAWAAQVDPSVPVY